MDPRRFLREVKRNPTQIINRVRFPKSEYDLLEIINFWQEAGPRLIEMGILDAFFTHLQEGKVPTRTDPSTRRRPDVVRASLSMLGLAKATNFLRDPSPHSDAIIRAWPGLFKWSVFFFSVDVQRSGGDPDTRQHSQDLIATSWYMMTRVDRITPIIAATKGSVELMTQLVILEDPVSQSLVDIPSASATLCAILREATDIDDALDRVVIAANGKAESIARLVMNRLKTAMNSPTLIMPMGLIIVDLIGHLSRRRGHPLRSAFFHHNVIPSMTKVALSGARRIRKGGQPPGLEAFMVSGFGYLANCLETTDGFSWVISAIQSGLMQAFLECSPLLSDLDNPADRYMILALFKDIIPKYMVYRSVIQVVDGAMQKVEATPAAHWVLDTPAKEVWLRFKNLASERMSVVNGITAIKGNEIKTCDNVNCQKIDLKNNFRKCGSCSTSLYCSKECQSIAWKEGGHKTTCQLKVQERLEGKNQSISKADIAFFHSITIEDLGDHLALLKEIAAKKYPGVPLTSLVACVNYDVSDPVYGVELLYGYEKLQPQTGGSAVAIARNEALIERVQENPDRFCLFQSRVANGEGTQLVLTMVGGDFWDTRNTTLEDTGEMSQNLINDASAVQLERMSDEEDEEETLTEEQEIELAKKTYNEIVRKFGQPEPELV